MEKLIEEINSLKCEEKILDERIRKEEKEISLLEEEAFDINVRCIVLQELLKKY